MKNSYVKLKDVAKLEWGNTSITKSSYVEAGFPAFSAAGSDGFLNHAEFEEDGIVLSAIGARCGKCFKAYGKWTAIKNTITIIPKKEKVNLNYLFTQLNDEKSWKISGAAQPFITLATVKDRLIQLPPLAEQHRIALLLDTADRILKKRESAIAKLDQLAQSVFVDYLKTIPDKKIKKLEDCVFDMHQGINTVTENIDYKNSGYPIIQSKHITSGYLSLDDVRYVSDFDFKKYKIKYRPEINDLLLCNIGTIGKSIIVNADVNFLIAWNLFLIKVDKNSVNPTYLKFYLDHLFYTKYFEKFLTGGTVKFISKKSLSSTLIELPSLSSQHLFVESITKIENVRKICMKSLASINLLIASLQHQSFAVN